MMQPSDIEVARPWLRGIAAVGHGCSRLLFLFFTGSLDYLILLLLSVLCLCLSCLMDSDGSNDGSNILMFLFSSCGYILKQQCSC